MKNIPESEKDRLFFKEMPKELAEQTAKYYGDKKMKWNKGEIKLFKSDITEIIRISKGIHLYHPEFDKYLHKTNQ